MASTGMTELGLIAVIVVQGFSLVTLWLRLRWRTRQEEAHRRYVVAVLRALPADSEIDERRVGGSLHKLTITRHREDTQL